MTNEEAMIPLSKSVRGGGEGCLVWSNPAHRLQAGSGLGQNVKIISLQTVASEKRALIMAT